MSKFIRYALVLSILLGTLVLIAYRIFAPSQDAGVTDDWRNSDEQSNIVVDHSLWQTTLDDYLVSDTENRVAQFDYQGYLDDQTQLLDEYIDYLSSINPTELNREEQFAFWVNLYNALTVQIVLENYPVDSIKNLGEATFPPGPWNDEAVMVSGKALTLNHIEHSILRPIWQDYRIHFAVNCASIGCPNLQDEAFTASNTEKLLNIAAEEFINHPRGLNLTNDELTLSSIFNWYSEDFGESQTQVVNLLSKHSPRSLQEKLANFDGKITYQYDWALNELQE